MRFVLLALLAWFIFQFIFRLVIPVYRASRQMRKGFQAMNERMNEQQKQQAARAFNITLVRHKTPDQASGQDPDGGGGDQRSHPGREHRPF